VKLPRSHDQGRAGARARGGQARRRALRLAAGLAATLALAQSALAATERATAARAANVPSTVLAGLDFNGYIGVPGAVSAAIVVPELNCKATPAAGSAIYVGVGIQSVSSYARLYLACTPRGAARYYPSLVVNGAVKDFPGDTARAGDTIRFAVSQSDSQVTDSVIDVTRRFVVTRNGTGSGTGEGIAAGDFAAVSGSTTSAVPDFGTLAFSGALINGYPFGSAGSGLQADDLSTSSTGPAQIETTYAARAGEAFATVFRHS
jgi:hypothetical protein